jgi:hypothetical protein
MILLADLQRRIDSGGLSAKAEAWETDETRAGIRSASGAGLGVPYAIRRHTVAVACQTRRDQRRDQSRRRASAFLKAKMKEAGITMMLKRGTSRAIFFLACIAALELEQVVLEEI